MCLHNYSRALPTGQGNLNSKQSIIAQRSHDTCQKQKNSAAIIFMYFETIIQLSLPFWIPTGLLTS